jgi:hypothetical protein
MFFRGDTDIFLKRIKKVVSNHFLHQDFFYFQIHDKIKQKISLRHFRFLCPVLFFYSIQVRFAQPG